MAVGLGTAGLGTAMAAHSVCTGMETRATRATRRPSKKRMLKGGRLLGKCR